MPATKTKNIYQRIADVMSGIGYIQKDARVMNYQAVTHDQVVGRIRPHLHNAGVLVIPTLVRSEIAERATAKGGYMLRLAAVYSVRFQNIDDKDDFFDVEVEAHAEDNGDKAPGKALSYATKNALLKVFMIETGVNDESRYAAEEERLISQKENEGAITEAREHIDGFVGTADELKAFYHALPAPVKEAVTLTYKAKFQPMYRAEKAAAEAQATSH